MLNPISKTLLLFWILTSLNSCSFIQTKNTDPGWIDDNTCEVTVSGKPLSRLKDINRRNESCKTETILMAQYKILNYFISTHEYIPDCGCNRGPRKIINPVIKKSILSGKIINLRYFKNQNCRLTLQITAKNLKSLVKNNLYIIKQQ